MYEAPIWGKKGWLVQVDEGAPAEYDLGDILKPIKDGLSYEGKMYAAPFYGESSFLFYRKDLMDKAGLQMPDQPTYDDITKFAEKLTDKKAGVYGICLRGKPGWGENFAYLSTLINTMGGRWFDEQWKPQLTSPEWKKSISWYVDVMKKYGPPGASSNGHNENRALFATGKCGMWIDATSAANYISDPKYSQVADKVAFAQAPTGTVPNGAQWLWSWALGIPASTKHAAEAKKFVYWATSKEYAQLVAKSEGWIQVPPGTRKSHLRQRRVPEGRPVRGAHPEGHRGGRPAPPLGPAGAVHGRAVRRHPRVRLHRDPGGAAGRRRAGRQDLRGQGARHRADRDRAHHEARRVLQVVEASRIV